ncbi:MAG: hypothetical protein WC341_08085, partial [Bacteroidales bacterium]
ITDLNGSIFIDDPNNKSGLKNFPQFPTFVSNDESYVFYNRKDIQDSTLHADRFYYRVDPFVFDSIKTFTTDGLAFKGTLVSSGIFSDITQPLVVMPDYSLGFKHVTPDAGYPIYNSKGTFTQNISLSNDGFIGEGSLKYLSSVSSSDRYIFYPDSLVAIGQTFNVEESPVVYDFPSVQGDTVDIRWMVDTNVMHVDNLSKPFIMYNNSWLKGKLALNPDYMLGDGAFYFDQSELVSNTINFNYNRLSADSADFYLKNREHDTLVFYANQYHAQINFEQQTGWFSHIYDHSFVEFPFNKYISTLDEVEWNMKEDMLSLQSNLSKDYKGLDTLNMLQVIDYQLVGPEFISVKEGQDSLWFFAGHASYNLRNYTIDIEDVKLIKVADAAIFPGDGKVRVQRDAQIETLNNAIIIADTKNKYHKLYDAEVNIAGRKRYDATAWIDYTDRLGSKQPIFLSQIGVNDMGVTTGIGQTPPQEVFFLSPEYFYQGDIKLVASDPYMHFDGGYRLNQECVLNYDSWVSFNQILNPEDIVFNLADSTFDREGRNVYFGLAYSNDLRKFYPLAFQSLQSEHDWLLKDAKGQLVFDTVNNSFVVGKRSLSTNGKTLAENVVLETNNCTMHGNGNLNLGLGFNMVQSTVTGSFEHLIVPDSTRMEVVLALNYLFDEKLLGDMTDSIRLSYNPGITDTKGIFPLFLKMNLPKDVNPTELIEELSLYGQIKKLPDLLKQTMIFSDLNLVWDSDSRSWISVGKIGLGYLGGQTINKYVEGHIQIEPGTTGSTITIYLQPTPETWYYFTYKNGIMQVMSSDASFNEKLELVKPEKRILNANSETDYYEYVISTKRSVVEFLREMEKHIN